MVELEGLFIFKIPLLNIWFLILILFLDMVLDFSWIRFRLGLLVMLLIFGAWGMEIADLGGQCACYEYDVEINGGCTRWRCPTILIMTEIEDERDEIESTLGKMTIDYSENINATTSDEDQKGFRNPCNDIVDFLSRQSPQEMIIVFLLVVILLLMMSPSKKEGSLRKKRRPKADRHLVYPKRQA